ncbi:MAG: hypothetical protein U0228_00620 [Myxococcaceae bacterium]
MRTISAVVLLALWCGCSPAPSGPGWVQAAALPGGALGGPNIILDGDTVLVGTAQGVARSTDDGVTWADSSAGLSTDGGATDVEAFGVVGTTLLAGGADGTFRSSDHGLHWQRSEAGLTTAISPYAFWTVGSTVLVGMNAGPNGVYRSTDGATTWSLASTGLAGSGASSFAQLGSTVFAASGVDVARSTDEGQSWSLTASPGPSNSLWVATHHGALFVATANAGVYTSTDGVSFSRRNNGLPSDIVSTVFSTGDALYAGTGSHGVFVSTNDGASWTAFSEGFPQANLPRAVEFALHGKTLLVVTEFGGVWRRALP